MAKRKAIGKKLRFEVFKRDSFTCQYCGRSAPDVLLHVDHIKPVANGGTNDITNLITSCSECNIGKGARELSDNTVIKKEKKQLDELNERREQLKMMVQWREELSRIMQDRLQFVCDYYSKKLLSQFTLNNNGKAILEKLIRKFGIDEVLQAIDISFSNYARFEDGERLTKSSAENIFNKISGICYNRQNGNNTGEIYYVVGIIRNRFRYCDKHIAIKILKAAVECGYSFDDLKNIAIESRNWSQWRDTMTDMIEED